MINILKINTQMDSINTEINYFGNDWGLFIDLENYSNNKSLDNYERMLRKYNIKIQNNNFQNQNNNFKIQNNNINHNLNLNYDNLNKVDDDIKCFCYVNNTAVYCFKKTMILGISIALSYGILYTISNYI